MIDLFNSDSDHFKALGHPVRLAIIRLVVQGCREGTPAGEIQERLGIPASTLSYHLACLAKKTTLVRAEREGTTLRYQADYASLRALVEHLGRVAANGVCLKRPTQQKQVAARPTLRNS